MNAELKSLLENRESGKAQVEARKKIIASLTGEESESHKESLAREEAGLASIAARISELEALEKPATDS